MSVFSAARKIQKIGAKMDELEAEVGVGGDVDDTAAVAAQTPLRLALGPEVASGTFHANKKAVKCKFADEQGARAALWEACEALAAERLR